MLMQCARPSAVESVVYWRISVPSVIRSRVVCRELSWLMEASSCSVLVLARSVSPQRYWLVASVMRPQSMARTRPGSRNASPIRRALAGHVDVS